jgi:hypothetical protein
MAKVELRQAASIFKAKVGRKRREGKWFDADKFFNPLALVPVLH